MPARGRALNSAAPADPDELTMQAVEVARGMIRHRSGAVPRCRRLKGPTPRIDDPVDIRPRHPDEDGKDKSGDNSSRRPQGLLAIARAVIGLAMDRE